MEKQRLDQYLSRLEYCLGAISVADKAEIITEIKSHVLDMQENYPEKSLDEILRGLGEPEQVASRYLSERGLTMQRPKTPTAKWLVIGFLGTMGMALFAFIIIVWKFSPLVDVNEETGRVRILGGLIDVQEKNGKVRIKGDLDELSELEIDINDVNLKGELDLGTVDNSKVLDLRFSNAKIDLIKSSDSKLSYNCEGMGSVSEPEGKDLIYDFSGMTAVECRFKVPAARQVKLNVLNGKVLFSELENDVNFKGANIKLEIKPASVSKYRYDLKVLNGRVDDFKNAPQGDSVYTMKVDVTNGVIEKI